MAYFIPTSIQKRLLRYALSKLEILDTDDLDLESLDISLGRKNTVELHDVRLRIQKVVSLLSLPDTLRLESARTLLLRITTSADIWNLCIQIQIQGVRIKLSLDESIQHGTPEKKQPAKAATSKGAAVPTTEDIAKSFLAEEPPEEKRELEEAMLSQSQKLQESEVLSDDGATFGTGVDLALPSFIAGYLRGIQDRLEVSVTDIDFELRAGLETGETQFRAASTSEASMVIHCDSFGLDGLTTNTPEDESEAKDEERSGKRHLQLQQLVVRLVADSNFLTSLSRTPSSASASPVQPRSPKVERRSGFPRSANSPVNSDRSQRLASPTSSDKIFGPVSPTGGRGQQDDPHGRLESRLPWRTSLADSERFADASDAGSVSSSMYGAAADLSHASRFAPISESYTQASSVGDEGPFEGYDPSHSALSHSAADSEALGESETRFALEESSATSTEWGYDSRPHRPAVNRRRLSATLPELRGAGPEDERLPRIQDRPVSRSQPLTGRAINDEGPGFTVNVPAASNVHSSRSLSPASSSGQSSSNNSASLSESKLFTHEDAESMYMSAFSEAPQEKSRLMDDVAREADVREQLVEPEVRASTPSQQPLSSSVEGHVLSDEGGATPRAASPLRSHDDPAARSFTAQKSVELPYEAVDTSQPQDVRAAARQYAKDVFTVSQVDAWIPIQKVTAPADFPTDHSHELRSPTSRQLPGSFSVHTEAGLDSQFVSPPESPQAQTSTSQRRPISQTSGASTKDHLLDVKISPVAAKVDLSIVRALSQMLTQVQNAFKLDVEANKPATKGDSALPGHESLLRLFVEKICVQFFEHVPAVPLVLESEINRDTRKEIDSLFRIDLTNLSVSSRAEDVLQIGIQKLTLGAEEDPVLSFDSSINMNSSIREPLERDISIAYKSNASGTDLSLSTLPIRISIDVQKIDDSLSCFGGLSGVLELSSSIPSPSPIASTPVKTAPRSRGVRFAGEPEPQPKTPLSGWKVNSRIGGMHVSLTGKTCGLSVETTSIRTVARERAISTSFSQLRFGGPYFDVSDSIPPLTARLENTRIDFFFTPEETDLDNLVSLITPSRDKYDVDDDIMLDTLLRQRQKGSLVRVNTGLVRIDLTDLAAAQQLQCLGEELSKLQGVTKYLPEDDRPGLLTMATIRDLKVKVPVQGDLAMVSVDAKGLKICHVAIPSLLATSIDTLAVTHGSDIRVVTEVLREDVDDSPMVMARMIGDEMVPTAKVKLFNFAIEYRVSTAMALLGLTQENFAEDLAASVASSIATVTGYDSNAALMREPVKTPQDSLNQINGSMHVEVLFRECAIGLNPKGQSSKALFLLSQARFHSRVPSNKTYSASMDLDKAHILIVDDVANLSNNPLPATGPAIATAGSQHVRALCQRGFVSMGIISKMHVSFQSWEEKDLTRLTEVNAGNDLFVLESCADSTQTLLNLLGALSPPRPPNKAEQFRTKVVPMEDMMASFSGDPVVRRDGLDDSDDEDEFDVDVDVDMIGSFYQTNPDDGFYQDKDDVFEKVPEDDLSVLRPVNPRIHANPPVSDLLDERCRVSTVEKAFTYEDEFYAKLAGTKSMPREWDSTKNEYGIASESGLKQSPLRIHLQDLHFIWNLFDGYDWAKTRQTIERAVQEVETKAEERRRGNRSAIDDTDDTDDVVGDFLFNSIWIEVPANKDPRELARNINHDLDDLVSETGSYATTTTNTNFPTRSSAPRSRRRRLKLQRGRHRKITFELKAVSADMYMFPPGSGETQSSVDVRVGDLEIFDHVPSSTWKKFATYMRDAGERELGKPMIRLELLNVKPIDELSASEAVLRVTVLPLRLHVDQDALDFITRFFEFKDGNDHNEPPSPGEQPFIQRLEVNTVSIKLDYKPKKVDYAGLRSGHTTEFMNFFILDNADIVLRHCIIYGVSGFDKLHKTLNDIWMPDVKRNQLPTVLAGLATVRPLVNVTTGVRDLVYIPMKEYKKDGRIVRSVQKGAVTFARTTTSELARLGAKLAIGTQNVLQGAENMLSPPATGSPSRRGDDSGSEDTSYPLSHSPSRDEFDEPRAVSNYADQPVGVVAGLRSAARSLERDLLMARDAIVAIPGEIMESESAGAAARVVARRAPTVILRTARGTSKAMGVALLGAGNALDPESQRRIDEKYKRY